MVKIQYNPLIFQ